jgi:hypothetical protein
MWRGAMRRSFSGGGEGENAWMRLLGIYLNDQLALGVAGRELAQRAASENTGTELGMFLERLAREVTEDVDTLEGVMERLEIPLSRMKRPLALVAERVGRLKPNGQLRGYSPLSRFLELESLALGLDGKELLWGNLRELANVGDRLVEVDFGALIDRAARQRDELEPFRVAAGREALTR